MKNRPVENRPSTPLRTRDYIDLGFAKYDLKREKIKGFPEVILGEGKDEKHLVSIAYNAVQKTKRVLITRVNKKQFLALKKKFKGSRIHQPVYYETAKIVYIGKMPASKIGKVVVVCAGTSDLPVAEEATFCLEIFGSKVVRLYDVGVAGLHRLLSNAGVFEDANVIVVVAGMEGALASVVTGLVSVPVIAVPTSIGYGASFGGLAPLLTMLNSCSAGMSVVNIDNGFGAAFQAHLINKLASR